MKNHLKLKVWAAVFCGGAAILAAFLYTLPTFAAGISKDSIIQKAALTGLHYCYTKGTMRESIEVGKYTGPGYLYSGDGTKKVAMPSGYTDRDTLTCTQILAGVTDRNKGSNAYPGLASTMGSLSTLTTPSAVAGFLGKMGYQKQTGEGDGQSCAVFTYTTTMETGFLWNKKTTTSKNTSTICLNTSGGKITSNKASVSYNRQSDSGSAGSDKSNNGLSFTISNNKVECGFIGNSKTVTVNFQKGDTWQSFYDNLLSSGCAKEEDAYIGSTLGGESTTITQHRDNIANNSAGTSAEFYKFPTGQKETAANSAIKTLSSNAYSSYANLAFNQEEKAILLQGYLEGFYKISNKGCDLSGDTLSLAQGDGYKAARIYDKEAGSFKTCYVKPQAHSGDKVYTWDSTNHININNRMTFDEVINALNGFTLTTLSDPSALENIVSDTAEPEEMSSITACFESAGALGWIACPVLEAAGNLAGVLYEYIESNFLQMNNDLVNDDGIQNAWAQFRNFTNILFAIMFVVVILAQVTGIGISNYNVKKILPRLIVVVILVNVSFLVCQLAVDVSNILGYSLKDLFDKFAQTAVNSTGGVPFNFGQVVLAITGAAAGTAGVVTTLSVLAITIPWNIWLFPLLLAMIGCVISVFFFMIMLGVRQAGILILITLSPVAIVCYALPNTKSIFDKWKKMFTGLLLVYPICGLVMGGGQFASTLLLLTAHNNDDVGTFFTIVAMLVAVVPFFMIPSILRNSMVAMGNLGAKISQFGKGASRGISRELRHSEFGRDIQRQGQMDYNLRAAQKLQKKQDRKEANGGSLGRGASRRLFRHASAYQRAISEDIRAGAGMNQELWVPGSVAYENAVAGAEHSQLVDDTKNQRSAYERAINTGDANAVGNEYEEQLENLHANPQDRAALLRVRALQDILSETDDGRSQVQGRMTSVLNRHRDYYTSPAAANDKSGLYLAAQHLSSTYGGQYKKANRGTFAMMNDFNNKQFTHAFEHDKNNVPHTLTEQMDSNGNSTGLFRSSYYDQKGTDSYTAQSLAEADDGALQGISNSLGRMEAMQRNKIVATAGDALGNSNIHMKPKVADQLQSMVINGNTAETLGGVNTGALNRMAENIEQHTMSETEQTQLTAMAQAALEGNHVTNADKAAALNHILAAAGQPTVSMEGRFDVAGDSADSGTVPIPRNPEPASAPTPIPNSATQPSPASTPVAQPTAPSNMPSLDNPAPFRTNLDGTVSGGVGPFRTTNGTVTQSGIVLSNGTPSKPRRGSRSSGKKRPEDRYTPPR